MTGSKVKIYSEKCLNMLRNVRKLSVICELCGKNIEPNEKILVRYINGKSHKRHVICHEEKII